MGEAFRWAGGGAQHPLQRQGLSGERNHSRPHPLGSGSFHPSRDIQEVLTSEHVARILADYAIEVRKLAYILSSGLAETEALLDYTCATGHLGDAASESAGHTVATPGVVGDRAGLGTATTKR